MAGVTIDSGKLEASMPSYSVPRNQWAELLNKRVWFVKERLPADCRQLVQFVDEAAEMYQELGFKSADDLIIRGLQLDPAEIQHALSWLRISKPDKAVSLKDASILGKHGTNQHTRGGDNVTSTKERGNKAAYGLARLERDRPDLAIKVRTNKLSVNAAAIEAGFRKLKTPLQQLQHWWKKANSKERAQFKKDIDV